MSIKSFRSTFKVSKLLASLLILSTILAAVQSGRAAQPTFADCLKNPFAPSCRGISAKRSLPNLGQQSALIDSVYKRHSFSDWFSQLTWLEGAMRALDTVCSLSSFAQLEQTSATAASPMMKSLERVCRGSMLKFDSAYYPEVLSTNSLGVANHRRESRSNKVLRELEFVSLMPTIQ